MRSVVAVANDFTRDSETGPGMTSVIPTQAERAKVNAYGLMRSVAQWEAENPFPIDDGTPKACPECGRRQEKIGEYLCPTCKSDGCKMRPYRTHKQILWVAGLCEILGDQRRAEAARQVASTFEVTA